MQTLKRGLGLVVAGLVVIFGAIMLASESGEVVVLSTTDAEGTGHETRLWVVEHDGALWLRAGVPDSAWLARLRSNPAVRLERAGIVHDYRAVPSDDAGLRDAINDEIAEKYGWAESLIALFRDGSASVPVRLQTLD